MNRRLRMLSSNLCCRFETVPHCEKKRSTSPPEVGCVIKNSTLSPFSHLNSSMAAFTARVAGKHVRRAKQKNCGKIAEKLRKNCGKLRTSTPPPVLDALINNPVGASAGQGVPLPEKKRKSTGKKKEKAPGARFFGALR